MALLLGGCSSLEAREVSEPARQMPSAVGQSGDVDGELTLAQTELPFDLFLPAGSESEPVIQEASPSGEEMPWEDLGQTLADPPLPGPLLRVLISETEGFGSQVQELPQGELTALEQVPSAPGIINVDGSFTPLQQLADEIQELPGSNPDGLYFEPQHASANYPWVVWREGSAGEPSAMPTLDADDWRVVAWNQETGVVREVMSAFILHGERFAPHATWDIAPTTDGTSAYFEATVPDGAGGWVNSVIAAPLDGLGEAVVVGPGMSPQAKPEGAGAYWIDATGSGFTQVVDSGAALMRIEGEGWGATRLAVSEALLVVTVSSEGSGWLLVWDRGSGALVAAVENPSATAEVNVSGREFVWGNGSAPSDPMMYHWDEKSGPTPIWGLQGLSAPLIFGSTLALPAEEADGYIAWRFLELKQ